MSNPQQQRPAPRSVRAWLEAARAEAAKHGAEIEEDEGAYQAVAPSGRHWMESDSYHIAMGFGIDERADSRISALRDGIDRMKSGTRPMTAEEYELAGEVAP